MNQKSNKKKKWYRIRISTSLATKCLIVFAPTILLVIIVGLYLPLVWMDKLVEEGKKDLARSEVDDVLQRHCQIGEISLLPLTKAESTAQPITHWIYLKDNRNEKIANDEFLKLGLEEFEKNTNSLEFIRFNLEQELIIPDEFRTESDVSNNSNGVLNRFMPDSNPGRYLRVLRTERYCLECHGSLIIESELAKIRESNDPNEIARREAELKPIFSEGELVGVISVILPAGRSSEILLINRTFIIMGGLISGLCALIAFYFIIQRLILKPVRSLREAAEQISVPEYDTDEIIHLKYDELDEDSELDTWLKAIEITGEINTGDEYEKLAVAFSHMLSRLKTAHEELRKNYVALDNRLGEMEARNIALYESNKLKSEFLANVSHELRTPLNAIIGFAEILHEQAQTRDDSRGQRYSSNVMQSGKLLLRIINDLLELARIEAGRVEIKYERFRFEEVVDDLIDMIRPQADTKQLEFVTNISPGIDMIESDAGKTQQIIFNLISNAVKFTPPKGSITVDAAMAEDGPLLGVEIFVTDTGPGIAPADRQVIFEKFRQLDGSVTRSFGGVGLGLAIVKELLSILGGDVSVVDHNEPGACFRIFLPVK